MAFTRKYSVYIATSLENVQAAKDLAIELKAAGYSVCSGWHDLIEAKPSIRDEEKALSRAHRSAILQSNLKDLSEANAMVFLSSKECRGSLVEFGFAEAKGIRILAVGDPLKQTLMTEGATWVEAEEHVLEALSTFAYFDRYDEG